MTPGRFVQSLNQWIDAHDPGRVELAHAIHAGIGILAAVTVAKVTGHILGLASGMDLSFPVIAAATAGYILFLVSPTRGWRASTDLAQLAAVAIGTFAAAAVLGPGDFTDGPQLMRILLVPGTFAAFWLRRYGPPGLRAGIVLFVVLLFVALLSPTREAALWLLLAAIEGAVIATLVHLFVPRPSAMTGFHNSLALYRRTIADALKRLMADPRQGPSLVAAESAIELRHRQARVAAVAAVNEEPDAKALIERIRGLDHRMRLAFGLVAGEFSALSRQVATLPGLEQRLLAAVAAVHASLTDNKDVDGRIAFAVAEIDAIRDALIAADPRRAPGPAAADRIASSEARAFRALAVLAALRRLAVIRLELRDAYQRLVAPSEHLLADAPETVPPPATTTPSGQNPASIRNTRGSLYARVENMPATTRVAVQAAVASAVTTAVDLAFHLNHGYWATLTVAFVLGNNFGETVTRARYRSIGTAAGVVLGILVASIPLTSASPVATWSLGFLCLAGLMVARLTMRDRYDIASMAIGFSVVLGLHLIAGLDYEGMLSRIYDTLIGAAAALVAARFVLPVYATDQIGNLVDTFIERCRAAFEDFWPGSGAAGGGEHGFATMRLAIDLTALKDKFPQVNAESMFGHRSPVELSRMVAGLDALLAFLVQIEQIALNLQRIAPAAEVTAAARDLHTEVLDAFSRIHAGGTVEQMASLEDLVAHHVAPLLGHWPLAGLDLLAEYTYFAAAVLNGLADLRQANAAHLAQA